MSKKHGHGQRWRNPPHSRFKAGNVEEINLSDLPKDWRELAERVFAFDNEQLKTCERFCREYIPGEAYPKHDPNLRYVTIFRHSSTDHRRGARVFSTGERPTDVTFVELPEDLKQ